MALDTAAKRAAAAHVKRGGKGVTPDATTPLVWRMAAGWNYGGNALNPPPPATGMARVLLELGVKDSFGTTPDPALGGRGGF